MVAIGIGSPIAEAPSHPTAGRQGRQGTEKQWLSHSAWVAGARDSAALRAIEAVYGRSWMTETVPERFADALTRLKRHAKGRDFGLGENGIRGRRVRQP